MISSNRPLIIILLGLIAVMHQGCASFGPVILGSTLGVAGQQGFGYFASGKEERIFYSEMTRSVYAVEKSFHELSIALDKKDGYPDGSIHFKGKSKPPRSVDVEVSLKPLSEGITEIAVGSRKGIFPDKTVCHTLMKNVEENINHTSR